MSDTALARELIVDIAGDCWNGKSDMIDRVHKAVSRHFKNWTRRRLRALWHREAALVKYHEMLELAAVARAEREARTIREGRKSHADYIAETARIAALLERTDADFHRPQIEGLRSLVGGMDSAGTGGVLAGDRL